MARRRVMKARGRSVLAKFSVPLTWRYGRDLTDAARRGQLDPVIGRDEEMARLIQILGRKTKNNPVLIGKSGVGKTAIVEGLALRIAEGMVPPVLLGKRLVSLDLATMLAGARIRGEFEERLKSALTLLSASKGEFVLLIDGLHMIVGTGSGDGGMDVSNMLKPMLARGELRLIGASAPDEYRKHVEQDAALERQFQPVYVEPPSARATIEILRGLRERHEVYHGVRICDSAIEAAVALSDRYVSGRYLPDKAVDLIDEAASRLRIGIESPPHHLDQVTHTARRMEIQLIALDRSGGGGPASQRSQVERDLAALRAQAKEMTAQWHAEQEAVSSIRRIKEELARKRAEAAQYERAGDLVRAADIEYGQIGELERRLEAAAKTLADLQAGGGMIKSEVDTQEVAAVVSAWTGVPVARLMEGEAAKLIQMEDVIRRRVIGQDEAVRAVSGPIRRSRAGLSDENRPIGTFLFLGPTGVGKTELARALAEFLFDNDHAMVRIDMGEYQERHTVARLIGAPPGYIGFHEGGQLTEAVHRRPYAVVLLDEIEKAHPDVFNTLLQLLDDGRLTDGHGRTVDFTNTVLIMTSNLREDPKDFFKPEFINRIDEIVRFRSLTSDDLSEIVRIQLRQLAGRAEGVGIKLEVDQAAEAWLAARGHDPEYGARPLRRVLQRELSDRLAVLLLDGTFHAGDTVLIGVADDQLGFHLSGQLSFIRAFWPPGLAGGAGDAPASFGIMILIFAFSWREVAAGLMDGSEETGARVRQIARDVFGLAVLRPAQVEAAAALAAGRDCLAVLPSGAGKSAIYQIAAVALGGPVVVVSPLLALQREQADALRARGLKVVTVNGLSGRPARQDADALLGSGRAGFIFLGPEQLARDDVRASLTRAPVRLVAVDEAHCIASWGHDFRPDYLRLGAVIEAFSTRPAVAALTATAAPPVRREITERLGLHDPRQVISDFDRPEIHLAVRAFHRAEDKRQAVLAAVRDQPGSGLVYAATRKDAEAYAALLGVRHYHGGLAKAERRQAQQAFESGATIVATSAFGMGMDRADVRFVVHASVSGSLDEYYQEIGRGGRDGQPAVAICCYRAEDLGMFRSFVAGLPDHDDLAAVVGALDRPLGRRELAVRVGMSPGRLAGLLNLLEAAGVVRLRSQVQPTDVAVAPAEAADRAVELARQHRSVERSRVEMMRRYAEMTDCRRRFLLRYFGEAVSQACGACDNCDAGRSRPVVPAGLFSPGERVEHHQWGPGLVLEAEADRLTVLFDDYGYRELATQVVSGRHLLAPA